MSRFSLGAPTLLLAVLAITIAWEFVSAFDAPALAPARADGGATPTVPALTNESPVDHLREWAAEALARPIFNPGRRPDSVAAVAGTAAPGLPRLTGVMIGPFGKRAIFDTGADGKPVTITEGDKIGGYMLRRIENDRVTVVGPSGTQDLRPAFNRAQGSQANDPRIRQDFRRTSLQRGPSGNPAVALEVDGSGETGSQ